jgi:hypothetical protein
MVGKGVEPPELKKLGIVVVTPFKLLTGFLPAAGGCEATLLEPSSGVLIETAVGDLSSGHERPVLAESGARRGVPDEPTSEVRPFRGHRPATSLTV